MRFGQKATADIRHGRGHRREPAVATLQSHSTDGTELSASRLSGSPETATKLASQQKLQPKTLTPFATIQSPDRLRWFAGTMVRGNIQRGGQTNRCKAGKNSWSVVFLKFSAGGVSANGQCPELKLSTDLESVEARLIGYNTTPKHAPRSSLPVSGIPTQAGC